MRTLRQATMTPAVRLGRVAGTPVAAHWSVLVTVGLVGQVLAMSVLPGTVADQPPAAYWITGLAAALLFLAGLLAHELAHAAVARHFGMRVERITLWALGGIAEIRDEPAKPRVDLLVALAGPATSVVVGVAFLGAGLAAGWTGSPALPVAAASWLGLMNLLLAVFNLLPGAPLDGGRVLRALLWWRHGDQIRAGDVASRAGQALGVALVGLGALQVMATGTLSGLWLALIGWFLISSAAAERSQSRTRQHLADTPVHAAMRTDFVSVPEWSTADHLMGTAAQGRQGSFPLVDLDGRPTGVVTLRQLAAVNASHRSSLRLRDVATPAGRPAVVSADAPLSDVVCAAPPPGGLMLVVWDGRLVGLLTEEDITRARELA